ncbi:LLM class flavin-dependent oxidoreductase [Kibdelosporangium phytohabitans]|uniref:Dehydrogenase n=1 Tax=Kibdelosporangium phytohabitans TaxID=860235 RepID=A0A0N9I341_9PSEU|nr:LLM class flavin-dependent oxidoreductase [Kibdelosporangium phytohabitans]ALG08907.1 dehydrogenase [Kibdelosporangium phytohabitans]MBE1469936.1 alkanesulfonate monooxygenase SsuD/methylene tetrahydromethanopterin reductase-like flavin-dependent oxidoreductase (luciferase family) [Kibdelosporangium phytohabitans]
MVDIGVVLPSLAVQQDEKLDLAAAARHAEDVGLASVWHGDHLAIGRPVLDLAIGLTVAATATKRVKIGASVFVPAIRPLAWAAKQVASLQYVSQGRLVLGLGSGGGAKQWEAAGVPFSQRGRRTDTALRLLPRLLAGEHVDEVGVALAPAVSRPPFWIGNASAIAIERAVRYGDGWFPSLITPEDVAKGAAKIGGRLTIAVGTTGRLGPDEDAKAEIAMGIAEAYGMPVERAARIPITGTPREAAERIAAFQAAGADHLVFGLSGTDWRKQCELLAEARSLI